MQFSSGQFGRLSELSIDIAKAMFISSLAIPVLTNNTAVFVSLKSLAAGLFFTYLSLSATRLGEVQK